MPITILNPHRSEPWAHAVQGLSGALEAYTRYKSEDRDYKLKLEEVARRRDESEQMRKMRDQDMAYREQQLARQAEGDNIQIEKERIGLEGNLGIAKDAADLSGLIKETTSTGFVQPPKIDKTAGLGAAPSPALTKSPDVGQFGTAPIAALGQQPSAPLAHMVAPQLESKTDTLAKTTAATASEFAAPKGKLTARERALGQKGIEDAAFRREVGESERKERVATETRKAEWKERDEAQAKREEAQSKLQAQRDAAAAVRSEKAQAAALERATLAAAKGNREAAAAADVDFLAQGGTLAGVPAVRRTQAAQAAKAAGVPIFETPGQKKAYEVADTSLAEAAELKRLLQTDKDVQSAFGTFAGRWNTSATSGVLSSLPGDIPHGVRRAIQLAQNLNDLRLRQRSGAAISESEAARLGKFSFDPTVPAEQMLVNIDPYIAELEAIRSGNSIGGGAKAGASGGKDPNDPEGILSPTEKAMRESGNKYGLKKPGSR